MTVFDMILPLMKLTIQQHITRASDNAYSLADELDKKGYFLCPICRKGTIDAWNVTPEGSQVNWTCGHKTLK